MTPRALAKPAFILMGKLRAQTLPVLDQPGERRQRLAELVVGILRRVVAVFRRAEDLFHFGVVIKERKKDGNALDDGSAQLRFDALPVVLEPSSDGIELRKFFGMGLAAIEDRAGFGCDPLLLQGGP